MKLFIETYNKAFITNQLNESDLHFAMHWVDNMPGSRLLYYTYRY